MDRNKKIALIHNFGLLDEDLYVLEEEFNGDIVRFLLEYGYIDSEDEI